MALIHKETSPFGDTIIFMNGVPLYKKWPNGRSVVFEKYGPVTTNADRDRGLHGANRLPEESHSVNNIDDDTASTPSQRLAKMFVGLSDDISANRELSDRATAMFAGIMDALIWASSEKLLEVNLPEIRDHLSLKRIIDLTDPGQYPAMPMEIRAPVRGYLLSLPGFQEHMGYKQHQTTFDSHAVLEMELTRLLGSIADKYAYIFGAPGDAGAGISGPSQIASADEEIPDDIMDVANALDYTRSGPTSIDIANAIFAERKRWEAEIERLRKAADYIAPYLRWTISEESPGYAPTMPSAVAAFHVAFDIDTQEKRIARSRKQLAANIAANSQGKG